LAVASLPAAAPAMTADLARSAAAFAAGSPVGSPAAALAEAGPRGPTPARWFGLRLGPGGLLRRAAAGASRRRAAPPPHPPPHPPPAAGPAADPPPPGPGARNGPPRMAHPGPAMSLAYSPDGKTVAPAAHDVRVWDAASGRLLRKFDLAIPRQDALGIVADVP